MTFPGAVEVFGQPAVVEVRGHLFAKKNQRGHDGRSGRTFVTNPDAAAIQWFVEQARHQWAGRAPVVNAAVSIQWFVAVRNRDRDGCWSTILDALQVAKVMKNDNMAQHAGPEFHHPIRMVKTVDDERVVITFWREWRLAAAA